MEWQISTAIAVIEKVFKGISGLLFASFRGTQRTLSPSTTLRIAGS
jgi:hypothetical protein